MVAFISAAAFALSGSKVTVAVFAARSTFTLATPWTFLSAFRTVIGQTAQGNYPPPFWAL